MHVHTCCTRMYMFTISDSRYRTATTQYIHMHRLHKHMTKNSKSPKTMWWGWLQKPAAMIIYPTTSQAVPAQYKQWLHTVCTCAMDTKNSYQHMLTSHRHRGSNWDRNVLAHTILLLLKTSQQRLQCTYLRTVWDVWDASIQSLKHHHSKSWMNIWRFLSASCFVQHSCKGHFLSILTTSCWAAVPLKSCSTTTIEWTTLISVLLRLWTIYKY